MEEVSANESARRVIFSRCRGIFSRCDTCLAVAANFFSHDLEARLTSKKEVRPLATPTCFFTAIPFFHVFHGLEPTKRPCGRLLYTHAQTVPSARFAAFVFLALRVCADSTLARACAIKTNIEDSTANIWASLRNLNERDMRRHHDQDTMPYYMTMSFCNTFLCQQGFSAPHF